MFLYVYGIGFKNTSQRRYLKIKEKKILGYIIDEILIKAGFEFIWLWVAIESKNKEILALSTSMERNMFVVAERFLSRMVNGYGKHPVSTDNGCIWYPLQAYKFLELDHHIHSTLDKSIIERTMQYIKDRIESFDDYFPCRKKRCNMDHIRNWLTCLQTIIIKCFVA